MLQITERQVPECFAHVSEPGITFLEQPVADFKHMPRDFTHLGKYIDPAASWRTLDDEDSVGDDILTISNPFELIKRHTLLMLDDFSGYSGSDIIEHMFDVHSVLIDKLNIILKGDCDKEADDLMDYLFVETGLPIWHHGLQHQTKINGICITF